MTTARIPWRPFLRHRYRAHAQGWLCVAVGLLTAYYVELYAHEPLWAVLPASFIAAFFVVAVGVAVAALLRFPWWFLAPLTFVSMAFEWALRRLCKRPWRRAPQPRERFLSNPFSLWQRWRIRRQRRMHAKANPIAPTSPKGADPFRQGSNLAPARRAPSAWSATGCWDFALEAWEGHFQFWFFALPVGVTVWLWLVDGAPFWMAALVSLIFWLLLSLVGLVPLAAALVALLSSLLVGAGMTPRSRWAYVYRRWAESAQRQAEQAAAQAAAATDPQVMLTTPPPRPVRWSDWLVPLAIGLWIGNAWGNDG